MICNNCGREIRDDSKFCGVCGAEVTHNQTGVQKPVSGKTNRYLVILIIISLLIVIILGIMIGLLIHRQKEYDRKHDSFNEYTESYQTDSEDDSVEIIIDQQDVLVQEDKTKENANQYIRSQGMVEDKEYMIPNAFYEMEVSYGEEKINTANAFLEEKGVANQTPFFVWGLDEHHPDCIIYYDTEKEKGCLFRLSYSGYDLAQIVGYTLTFTEDELFKPEIPGKEESPFLFKFIELKEEKAKDICPSCDEKHTPDYSNGKVSEYVATGVIPGCEEEGEQTILSLQWFYREDGSLQRRIYHHSPYSVGTAWSDVDTYYDEKGRILYENYYVTSGCHDIYAIYPENRTDAYYVDIDPMAGNDLYIYHVINDADYMNGCYFNLSYSDKLNRIRNNYNETFIYASYQDQNVCKYCGGGSHSGVGTDHYYPDMMSVSIDCDFFAEIRDKYPGYVIDYYFQNWEVSYVCAHNDTEEHIFYLDINQPHKCICYRGPDNEWLDFEDGIDAKEIIDIGIACDYVRDDKFVSRLLNYDN